MMPRGFPSLFPGPGGDNQENPNILFVIVHKNGDIYNRGHRITINLTHSKSWDSIMEEIRSHLGAYYPALRFLIDNECGSIIVRKSQLGPNKRYVAVPRGEEPKFFNYAKAEQNTLNPRRVPTSNELFEKYWRKHAKLMLRQPGRICEDLRRKPKTIMVYRNGDSFTPAIRVVLRSSHLTDLDVTLKTIQDFVILMDNKPIRKPGPRSINRQSKPRHKKFPVRMDNKSGEQHKPSVKNSTGPSPVDAAAARIQAGYRGYHFRKTHPELTHTVHIARQHQDAPNIHNNPRATEPHELTPSTAATRIQAGYRGYQTRKQMHQHDEPKATQSTPHGCNQSQTLPPDVAAAKIQAGFRGYRTRRELREHHEHPETVQQSNLSNLNEIRSDPNYAATRIQATFRGYQTRRALQEHNSNPSNMKYPLRSRNCNSCSTTQSHTRCHHDERDPEEVNKAATIIQAGFRGYQTRKHLHSPHTSTHESHPTGGPVNKENAEQAATRIQAAYRGFSTRKNLHETGPTTGGNMDTNRSITTPTTRYSDPSEAATKIQATFRGYRTRRQVHVPHGNADQKLTRRDPTRTAR